VAECADDLRDQLVEAFGLEAFEDGGLVDNEINDVTDKVPINVTLALDRSNSHQFKHLDWDAAYEREIGVMKRFNMFGKVVDGSLLPPGAPCYRVSGTKAIKAVGTAKEEARVRAVVIGCSGWVKGGTGAPVYDKRHMLPASNLEVQLMTTVAKLKGFQLRTCDVSGGYPHVRMTKDAHGNSTFVKLEKRLLGVLSDADRELYESLKDPYVILEGNLYGHKLAGFLFEEWIAEQFKSVGLSLVCPDISTAMWARKDILLLRFVDDFMIAGTERELRKLEAELKKLVALKGDGFVKVGEFLGATQHDIGMDETGLHVTATDMRSYVKHAVT
jgi:hypothetical protein